MCRCRETILDIIFAMQGQGHLIRSKSRSFSPEIACFCKQIIYLSLLQKDFVAELMFFVRCTTYVISRIHLSDEGQGQTDIHHASSRSNNKVNGKVIFTVFLD